MHHAQIDRLAYQASPIHALDARVKLVCALIFSIFVISLPATSVSILACYAIWPFAVLVIAGVPISFVLKHILIVSPFILVLALSSLLYDKAVVTVAFGPWRWETTGGVCRCFSIFGKFIITMAALVGLVATTRFSDLLAAMAKLGVPHLLVVQLGFLYRYIFMLIDRGSHVLRARAGRKLRNLGLADEVKTTAAIVGSIFIGSIDLAGRVNMAMQGRGFDGRFHRLTEMRITGADFLFAAILTLYLVALQFLRRVFY
ncbi:MAG: cobalt ECF transporter T component CbiQ [Planctomycetota bacterium]|nr:MAG: cobalt ECF transporter T component CbiQ [Planctomycetota bacterium]